MFLCFVVFSVSNFFCVCSSRGFHSTSGFDGKYLCFFFLLCTVTCCLSILTVSCSYLFRQCVCIHMCCCVCAYVCAHSCRGQLWVLVFAFHLLWGKASCLLLYVPACPTHKLLKTLLCLPSVSPEEYCDYRCLLPCSAFSMFSASNLGHLTCVASILPTFKLLLKGFTSN